MCQALGSLELDERFSFMAPFLRGRRPDSYPEDVCVCVCRTRAVAAPAGVLCQAQATLFRCNLKLMSKGVLGKYIDVLLFHKNMSHIIPFLLSIVLNYRLSETRP